MSLELHSKRITVARVANPTFVGGVFLQSNCGKCYILFGWSEVKLGGSEAMMDEAAARLVAVTGRIDISRRTPSAAHLLVTAFGAASYQRADGVTVAPLTALGPCAERHPPGW